MAETVMIPKWMLIALVIVLTILVGATIFEYGYSAYNNFKLEQIKVGFAAGYDQALTDVVTKVKTTGSVIINIARTNETMILVSAPS